MKKRCFRCGEFVAAPCDNPNCLMKGAEAVSQETPVEAPVSLPVDAPVPAPTAAPGLDPVAALVAMTNTQLIELLRSSEDFSYAIMALAALDAKGLARARIDYGESWAKRGGVGAFMNCARKWDRLETICANAADAKYDLFTLILRQAANGGEGALDAVRDLRRYLMLVEEKLLHSNVTIPISRDNRDG